MVLVKALYPRFSDFGWYGKQKNYYGFIFN